MSACAGASTPLSYAVPSPVQAHPCRSHLRGLLRWVILKQWRTCFQLPSHDSEVIQTFANGWHGTPSTRTKQNVATLPPESFPLSITASQAQPWTGFRSPRSSVTWFCVANVHSIFHTRCVLGGLPTATLVQALIWKPALGCGKCPSPFACPSLSRPTPIYSKPLPSSALQMPLLVWQWFLTICSVSTASSLRHLESCWSLCFHLPVNSPFNQTSCSCTQIHFMRSSTSLIPYGNILSLLPAQLAGTALPFPKSPPCLQPDCHPSSLVNSHSISHPKTCPDLTSPRWSVFSEHRHIYIPYIPHIHLLSFCIWYYVLRGITYQKLLILRYRLTEICKNGIESYVPFTQLPPMLRFYVTVAQY